MTTIHVPSSIGSRTTPSRPRTNLAGGCNGGASATALTLRALLALASFLVVVTAATAAPAGTHPVTDDQVNAIAAQLRCVVCQNLSVADSPSEMAAQMRGIVREHLAAGESPEQVRNYFVERYGEWILLSPRRRGFNLLVWGVPVVTVLLGFVVVGVLLHRWTRRRPRSAVAPVDPAMSERIRREMEAEP